MEIPAASIVERKLPDETTEFYFIQGQIEIAVFPPSEDDALVKSIDQIDKLPAGRWTEFAIQNDLPVEPFDRRILKPSLMGVIQIAWHTKFSDSGPSERLIQNQVRRIETYRQDLEQLKVQQQTPIERRATGEKKAKQAASGADVNGATKTGYGPTFRLSNDEKAAEAWSQFTGQQGLIVAVMVACGAMAPTGPAINRDTITTTLRGKLNTKQPEERVVAYYMAQWIKEGLVEKVSDTTIPIFDAKNLPANWEEGAMTKEKIAAAKAESKASKPAATPEPEAAPAPEPAATPEPAVKKSAAKKSAAKKAPKKDA